MGVRVAVMDDLAAALVQGCVLRDRGQVMPVNGGAYFVLITVIDVRIVWIRDFGDLTDASGRQGSPRIGCGVPPRVLNGIDEPVAIVGEVGGVPVKICVMV